MASISMSASFLSSTTVINQSPAAKSRRRVVVASVAKGTEGEKVGMHVEAKNESNNGRRELVFAAAAAAVCSVAGIAMADEPPRGSSEARKFYAPVCVTMPTARICHK